MMRHVIPHSSDGIELLKDAQSAAKRDEGALPPVFRNWKSSPPKCRSIFENSISLVKLRHSATVMPCLNHIG